MHKYFRVQVIIAQKIPLNVSLINRLNDMYNKKKIVDVV